MEKKEILVKINNLNNKIQSINNWIRNNPETIDPNMYEITSCWCEYGENLRLLNDYYNQNGWPKINGVIANHYDLWRLDDESKKCRLALRDMNDLRNLDDCEFFDNETMAELFNEICARTTIGEYDIPTDANIAAMKKEVLCKSMSIPFHIWQTRTNNQDYQYDDEKEWNYVLDSYQLYKDAVGIQTRSYSCDNGVLILKHEGPQFGKEIESVIDLVNSCYKYSNNDYKKLEKK